MFTDRFVKNGAKMRPKVVPLTNDLGAMQERSEMGHREMNMK